MIYHSTRDCGCTANSVDAVLRGIAPDGGLYVANPSAAQLDWRQVISLSAREMSAKILHALLPDFEDMDGIVTRAYENKFETEDLVPVVSVGERLVLELFRGPTCAFKDVALSVLPHLITAGRKQTGEMGDVVILTATSGDTGKAALEGFHDVPGTRIVVFYPYHAVSRVQELQMSTQVGENVRVCAVRGNFDDAQTGVKQIFRSSARWDLKGRTLSSANSINIGRLAPQVMYYFKAYGDAVKRGTIAVGQQLNFVVPTGNFGDILAGYYAKCMGLPVGKLVCASNQNKVLTDFLATGRYDRRREFYKTCSPSMDILVSSNLERLLFLLTQDDGQVADWMQQLSTRGFYEVSAETLARIRQSFDCGCCSDEDCRTIIGSVFKKYGYLMDPHTAVGWKVADEWQAAHPGEKLVVLSTASPFKFSEACLQGLGQEPGEDEFASMQKLSRISGVPVPPSLAGLQSAAVLHRDVIECRAMEDYVLQGLDH